MASQKETLFESVLIPDVVAQLNALKQALASVSSGLSQLGSQVRQAAPAPRAGAAPPVVLSLPGDPEVINRLLVVARFLGVARVGVQTNTIAVPAGGAPVTLELPVLQGTVNLFLSDLVVVSNYITSALSADVNVDGVDITPAPYEYHLVTSPLNIPLGQFYYIERTFNLTVTNSSATNALVSGVSELMALDADWFHTHYLAAIHKLTDALTSITGGTS